MPTYHKKRVAEKSHTHTHISTYIQTNTQKHIHSSHLSPTPFKEKKTQNKCTKQIYKQKYIKKPYDPTWNLYISPLRTLLSTVPPNTNIASPTTAAAWKSLPEGTWESEAGWITDQVWLSRSKLKETVNRYKQKSFKTNDDDDASNWSTYAMETIHGNITRIPYPNTQFFCPIQSILISLLRNISHTWELS